MIEKSAAFKDGGLIDITFDEANPPFTNTQLQQREQPGRTAGTTPATAVGYAKSDAAGESFINGRTSCNTRADRPEHAAAEGRQRQPALPGSG